MPRQQIGPKWHIKLHRRTKKYSRQGSKTSFYAWLFIKKNKKTTTNILLQPHDKHQNNTEIYQLKKSDLYMNTVDIWQSLFCRKYWKSIVFFSVQKSYQSLLYIRLIWCLKCNSDMKKYEWATIVHNKSLCTICWHLTHHSNASQNYNSSFPLFKNIWHPVAPTFPHPFQKWSITCNMYMHKDTQTDKHIHALSVELANRHTQQRHTTLTDTYTDMHTHPSSRNKHDTADRSLGELTCTPGNF